jgi:hypothetical protein
MSARPAIHWPLVLYRGSQSDLRGSIWQDISVPGHQLTLKNRHGNTLIKVNRASVTDIDIPSLRPDRVEALRWLMLGWDRVPAARVLRWLIRHDLAQQTGERIELTELGQELADALIWY